MSFSKGGCQAWYHRDEQLHEGYFHTYDCLKTHAEDVGRKVHIWLPQDYEISQEHYPVLYFCDGNTTFWPGGCSPHSWKIQNTFNNLWRDRKAKKVLVVAVHPIDRNREYTHTFWAPGMGSGGVIDYSNYLAFHLKPWVDQNYKTLSDCPNTFIIGSSHGGLAAFIIACRHPGVFGTAGCFSPSFWAGMGFGYLEDSKLLELTESGLAKRPRLFFTYGLERWGGFHNFLIEELASSRTKEMASLLISKYGYDDSLLSVYEDPVGKHEEITWEGQFQIFASKYLGLDQQIN